MSERNEKNEMLRGRGRGRGREARCHSSCPRQESGPTDRTCFLTEPHGGAGSIHSRGVKRNRSSIGASILSTGTYWSQLKFKIPHPRGLSISFFVRAKRHEGGPVFTGVNKTETTTVDDSRPGKQGRKQERLGAAGLEGCVNERRRMYWYSVLRRLDWDIHASPVLRISQSWSKQVPKWVFPVHCG